MDMVTALDADKYYAALDKISTMEEYYANWADTAVEDRKASVYRYLAYAYKTCYDWLANAEIQPDGL